MKRPLRILIVSLSALALMSCAPERPSDQGPGARNAQDESGLQPVAVVNGSVITLDDFQRRLDGVAPYARPRYAALEKRGELLESMVVMELLAEEAETRGLGEHPAVVQAMKETMSRLILQERLRERVNLKDITDAQISAYYDEHRREFVRPEQRKLLTIAGDSKEQLDALKAEIEGAGDLDAVLKSFRRKAATSSLDASSRRAAGDIGYHEPPRSTRKRMAFSVAAYKLTRVGQISEPFKEGKFWWLVTFVERKASEVRAKSEVTSKIRATLYDQLRDKARAAFLEEIRQGASVETYKDVLQKARAPQGSNLPELTPRLWRAPVRDLDKNTVDPRRAP